MGLYFKKLDSTIHLDVDSTIKNIKISRKITGEIEGLNK